LSGTKKASSNNFILENGNVFDDEILLLFSNLVKNIEDGIETCYSKLISG